MKITRFRGWRANADDQSTGAILRRPHVREAIETLVRIAPVPFTREGMVLAFEIEDNDGFGRILLIETDYGDNEREATGDSATGLPDDDRLIVLDENQLAFIKDLTLLHELAHFILHPDQVEGSRDGCHLFDTTIEREAEVVATAVLAGVTAKTSALVNGSASLRALTNALR